MIKKAITAVIIIAIIAAGYFFGPGFVKQGNVYLESFSVSDSGIAVKIGVSDSVGYIRKATVKQLSGGKMYVDCYSAFGGINGKIGAESSFTLPVNDDTDTIAFYENENCYKVFLEKDDNGDWHKAK